MTWDKVLLYRLYQRAGLGTTWILGRGASFGRERVTWDWCTWRPCLILRCPWSRANRMPLPFTLLVTPINRPCPEANKGSSKHHHKWCFEADCRAQSNRFHLSRCIDRISTSESDSGESVQSLRGITGWWIPILGPWETCRSVPNICPTRAAQLPWIPSPSRIYFPICPRWHQTHTPLASI